MTGDHSGDAFATVLQAFAILAATAIIAMILQKGFADVSALALEHSGEKFWQALARYVLRNLGGG